MTEQNTQPVDQTEEDSLEIVELDLTFKPEIFDPNVAQLEAIAAEVAKIEADPTKMTKDDLELINTTKNKLVKARTRIQKIGKAQRDPATKFAKEVKAYEDKLLAILAPEETRMKTLESAAKEHAMREERMKTLPDYIAKLDTIGDGIVADEAFLLSLDPNQRDAYYVQRLTAKVEADAAAMRAEDEARKQAAEAEAQKILNKRREILLEAGFKSDMTGLFFDADDATITVSNEDLARMTESEFLEKIEFWRKIIEAKKAADLEKAKEEAKQKAEEEAKQRAAAEEAQRQAAEEAAKKGREEAERKAKEEEEARRSSEAFQKWKNDNSYNEDTDIIQVNEGVYTLYRKVSSYQPQAFGFQPSQLTQADSPGA